MKDIDVVRLILEQIGELRVPIREEALRTQIMTIAQNLNELKEAMERRDAEAAEKPEEPEEEEGPGDV